jgi:hypothetical protein
MIQRLHKNYDIGILFCLTSLASALQLALLLIFFSPHLKKALDMYFFGCQTCVRLNRHMVHRKSKL